jgi:L-alanine-DL-glutamate epimerase-like enolase superfamily enzyme
MKIADFRVTPMTLRLKKPNVWSQGVEHVFLVNLIEIEADNGIVGIGETTTAPDAAAQAMVLRKITRGFIGQSVLDSARLRAEAYRAHFLAFGGNMPRYANQMLSGIDMACLDLMGKSLGVPVWDLLGGARRDDVGHFYFLQGDTIEDLVADAKAAVADGHPTSI